MHFNDFEYTFYNFKCNKLLYATYYSLMFDFILMRVVTVKLLFNNTAYWAEMMPWACQLLGLISSVNKMWQQLGLSDEQ